MKILVIGGGGREHALVWKLSQSTKASRIYCAPGNAGIAKLAKCVDIAADNLPGLLAFAQAEEIDLTVVGPEGPLVQGIVDQFRAAGLKIFGPAQKAAAIEGSKAFAKELMVKYGIPTARYGVFWEPDKAREFIRGHGAPCVVKADGLAAGKGVVVAMDEATALAAVDTIMEERSFGQAGERVVIEEYLEGEEVSLLAFTDGRTIIPMVSAQDHKRVFDGDAGPNTGGMGAYSPAPIFTPDLQQQVLAEVLLPTIQGMAKEGHPYQGVLYAGLMLTKDGPKVLEYNARFGDPETQPILMRLETDLLDIMMAVVEERLAGQEIRWLPDPAVCVVLAAGGYPGSYRKGDLITGLDPWVEQESQGVMVFHAGTAEKDGQIVTAGGRVLGVTSRGGTIPQAIQKAYNRVAGISFPAMHYRTDIGKKARQQ
ncbi:MAG: phosphoribosylamine--glycine ligase [Syntrophomonadaceae bacterium]|nr:phosphoribosylamine--glycine ligase [Syntrophomonadaceae bacterium]